MNGENLSRHTFKVKLPKKNKKKVGSADSTFFVKQTDSLDSSIRFIHSDRFGAARISRPISFRLLFISVSCGFSSLARSLLYTIPSAVGS